MHEWLRKLLEKVKAPQKKLTKFQYIGLIVLIAILILVFSSLFNTENTRDSYPPPNAGMEPEIAKQNNETWKQQEESSATSEMQELEKAYEADLASLLEKITGVSEVEVMVNLNATDKQIYQTNLVVGSQITSETDQNGGTRKIDDETREQTVVVIRQGEQEIPLLVQTEKPEVRGVLVVARGVHNLEIKKWVTEAVTKVLDVPAHRVSVMPKNK